MLAGVAASATAVGASALLSDSRGPPATERMAPDRERRLAEAYAPDLYFGEGERWYPTDPRRYASERDGRTVVDGFDALDGYTREFRATGAPPEPTVFYHGRRYSGTSLGVIQFWFYSVFDQFSVNFHWHDWEVLHAFVDLEAEADGGSATADSTAGSAAAESSTASTTDSGVGQPMLFVASAHAPSVPNNEYLGPETDRASVISEVGSHSSALGVNATKSAFERIPTDLAVADINNAVLELVDLPAAYGLPRDEGFRLPFSLPELDGAPLYEHPKLPHVGREDLLPPELTVRSFHSLPAPPEDLPLRVPDLRFGFEGRADAGEADHTYALAPMADLGIDALTGPQLSFAFAVPKFAEDAVASHLTTAARPSTQPRFENPLADVTDADHRAALARRFGIRAGAPGDFVVASLREAAPSPDAPGGNGVQTRDPAVEGVALLESDPVAVPTFNGVVALQGVPAGTHRLTVNGAGVAPYAERFEHDGGGTTAAGADGRVVVTPNADAVKLRADATGDDAPAVARFAIEDDFAGRVYDATPVDPDRPAAYVHTAGAYTAELEDETGRVGAFRVNPDADQATATLAELRTGKAQLASYLATLLTETFAQARAFGDGDADGIAEVDVPDDTAERAGRTVEEALDALTNATEGIANGTADAVSDVTNATGGTTATPTAAPDAADVVANESDVTDATNETDDATNTTDGDTGTATETTTETTATSTPEDDEVLDVNALDPTGLAGLLRALEAAARQAARAARAAENGNAEAANRRLRGLRRKVAAVRTALERNRKSLPGNLGALVAARLPRVERRIDQALAAG